MVLETVKFHLSRDPSRSSCLLPTFNQGKCKKDSHFIDENIHKPQISNKEQNLAWTARQGCAVIRLLIESHHLIGRHIACSLK